jgi:hypothetical protein
MIITCWPSRSRLAERRLDIPSSYHSTTDPGIVAAIDNYVDINVDYRLLPHAGVAVQVSMNDTMEAMPEELYGK